MDNINTLETALEFARIYAQYGTNQIDPTGGEAQNLVEFIKTVKAGLDEIIGDTGVTIIDDL